MRAAKRIFRLTVCAVMLIILAVWGYNAALRYLYPKRFSAAVQKYSSMYGVEEELVYAVIKCESNFKTDASSHAGAKGLMQLTEETFNDVGSMLGEQNIPDFSIYGTDAEINIKYGTKYLSYLLGVFNGDKTAAVAAYNAGMGNVKKWIGEKDSLHYTEIRFDETSGYVRKVQRAESIYKKLYS